MCVWGGGGGGEKWRKQKGEEAERRGRRRRKEKDDDYSLHNVFVAANKQNNKQARNGTKPSAVITHGQTYKPLKTKN